MVCKNCGAEIEQGNMFCLLCGTKVEPEAEPSEAKAPAKAKKSILELLSTIMGILCTAIFTLVFFVGTGSLKTVGIVFAIISLLCTAFAVLRLVSSQNTK